MLALNIAVLAKARSKSFDITWLRRDGKDTYGLNPPRLLPLGDERRGEETTRHRAEECPSSHYWITSSARPSSDWGIVRPRAFAVLRLMTSSNFVGCSIGRSAHRRRAARFHKASNVVHGGEAVLRRQLCDALCVDKGERVELHDERLGLLALHRREGAGQVDLGWS